jgi:hypothetical protein
MTIALRKYPNNSDIKSNGDSDIDSCNYATLSHFRKRVTAVAKVRSVGQKSSAGRLSLSC